MGIAAHQGRRSVLESRSLLQSLEGGLDSFADQQALCSGTQSFSHYQLDEFSTVLAAFLQTYAGLQPGDVIAIEAVDTPAGIIAFYGAVRAGLKVFLPGTVDPDEGYQPLLDHDVRVLIRYQPDGRSGGLFADTRVELLMMADSLPFTRVLKRANPRRWQRPKWPAQQQSSVLWQQHQKVMNYSSGQCLTTLPQALQEPLSTLLAGQVIRY